MSKFCCRRQSFDVDGTNVKTASPVRLCILIGGVHQRDVVVGAVARPELKEANLAKVLCWGRVTCKLGCLD